jgi:hypothetical protein
MTSLVANTAEEKRTPTPIHYGPIYGRPVAETMALCKPPDAGSLMSDLWGSVTCPDCLKRKHNGKKL